MDANAAMRLDLELPEDGLRAGRRIGAQWLGGADLIRLRARQVANFTTEMQSNDFVMKSAEATDLADGGF
jgi:hypothetical protein